MPRRLAIRAGFALVGVVVMLVYWRTRSPDPSHESTDHLPDKVWAGGGAVVTMVAEASAPAKLRAVFETSTDVTDASHRSLETWQSLPEGKHTFTIDVAAKTHGSVEVLIEQHVVGATASVSVQIGTRVVAQDQITLEPPLQKGYAFAAMVELDDWADGVSAEAD